MVINFNDCNGGGGSITITGTTGTLNLSTASADEVKAACENMDQYVFLAYYGNKTYVEEMRNDAYQIYFYVTEPRVSAATAMDFQLRETLLSATLHPDTGLVTFSTGETEYGIAEYAPNIIYTLNGMSEEQVIRLRERLMNDYQRIPVISAFMIRWHRPGGWYVWNGNWQNVLGGGLFGYAVGENIPAGTDAPVLMVKTQRVLLNADGSVTYFDEHRWEVQATLITNS